MGMNPEVKQQWVDALRSGQFKQAKGALKLTRTNYNLESDDPDDMIEEDRHCCLGVLCEIAVLQGVIGPTRKGEDYLRGDWIYGDSREASWAQLPNEVIAWAEVETPDPLVVVDPVSLSKESLSTLNDGGKTFEQIADYIERSL